MCFGVKLQNAYRTKQVTQVSCVFVLAFINMLVECTNSNQLQVGSYILAPFKNLRAWPGRISQLGQQYHRVIFHKEKESIEVSKQSVRVFDYKEMKKYAHQFHQQKHILHAIKQMAKKIIDKNDLNTNITQQPYSKRLQQVPQSAALCEQSNDFSSQPIPKTITFKFGSIIKVINYRPVSMIDLPQLRQESQVNTDFRFEKHNQTYQQSQRYKNIDASTNQSSLLNQNEQRNRDSWFGFKAFKDYSKGKNQEDLHILSPLKKETENTQFCKQDQKQEPECSVLVPPELQTQNETVQQQHIYDNRSQDSQRQENMVYGPLNLDELSTQPSFNNDSFQYREDWPFDRMDSFEWQRPNSFLEQSTKGTLNSSLQSMNEPQVFARRVAGSMRGISLSDYNQIIVISRASIQNMRDMGQQEMVSKLLQYLIRLNDFLNGIHRNCLLRRQRKQLFILLETTRNIQPVVGVLKQMSNFMVRFENSEMGKRRQCLLQYAIIRQRLEGMCQLSTYAAFEVHISNILNSYRRREIIVDI